jgi:hypothetical protein
MAELLVTLLGRKGNCLGGGMVDPKSNVRQ